MTETREERALKLETICELVVNGMTNRQIKKYITEKYKWELTKKEVERYVKASKILISDAADVKIKSETGMAIKRCEALYTKSMMVLDTKTALQAQRELNKLLKLYDYIETAEQSGSQDAEKIQKQLKLTADYLLPLKLADPKLPIEEHARIAAEIIRGCGKLGSNA